MLRTFVAGYVDAFSLLKLKVFTSFMSGNTTSTGMKTGQGQVADAACDFLPIPCFVLGTFLGSLLQKNRTARSNFLVTACVVACLLLAAIAIRFVAPNALAVVVLALAMGMLNTTVAHVAGQSVNTGFVTGDLKNLGEHLASAVQRKPVENSLGSWDTQLGRAGILGIVWLSFFAGAMLGASIGVRSATWALVAAALILFVTGLVALLYANRVSEQAIA